VLLSGLTVTEALHRRRQLVGRPRTAFRCRQGTVSVKELPIRVHHFQVRLDLALKLCLQLVLDLLHYCERPLLQLINGEEVSNETAPKRDRKAQSHCSSLWAPTPPNRATGSSTCSPPSWPTSWWRPATTDSCRKPLLATAELIFCAWTSSATWSWTGVGRSCCSRC
jgi:hypothetical protein